MRDQGRLTDWDDEKGFGFVTPEQGGLRAFVHIRAFSYRPRRPRNGDLITYQLSWDAHGRARAENVLFRGEVTSTRTGPDTGTAAAGGTYWAIAAMLTIVALAAVGRLSWLVPLGFFIASTTLFIVYAFDKSAAMNRRWRVSEDTLHLFALLGGWPGALVAQSLFHHKSKKRAFRATQSLIIFINVVILAASAFNLDQQLLHVSLLEWLRP